jgi:FkbM family methyltransferase
MTTALGRSLLDAAAKIERQVARAPRRQPGQLDAGGRVIRYADLHSFYHQTRQIFGARLYATSHASSAPVILDCGAHIGLASLFFKDCDGGARIHAYEADANIANMCRANLAACGYADVAVTAAAVWTHDGGAAFDASADDSGHVDNAGGSRVPSVRLRDVLAAGPVDLVKLDIEGAEFEVLPDCGEALRNVRRMIVEVHAFGHSHDRIGALLGTLEASGFRYVFADLHHATWKPRGDTPFSAVENDKYYFTIFAWRDD